MCVSVWVKMPQGSQSRFRPQSLLDCQTLLREANRFPPRPQLLYQAVPPFLPPPPVFTMPEFFHNFLIWPNKSRLPDVCAGQQDKGSSPVSLLTVATEADLPLLFPSHGAFCGGKTALIHLLHPLKSSTFCSLIVCVSNQNSLCVWTQL